jgi:hypothetical protein
MTDANGSLSAGFSARVSKVSAEVPLSTVSFLAWPGEKWALSGVAGVTPRTRTRTRRTSRLSA